MHLPTPPVLLIIFARPALTARVFDAIRAARPSRLFIAQDGPRANHPEDAEKCRRTRAIATAVDWPCGFDRRWKATPTSLSNPEAQGRT